MTSLEPGWNVTFPAKISIRGQDQWNIRSTMRGIVEIESVEGADGAVVDALMFKGDKGDQGRDGFPPQIHLVGTEAEIPELSSLDDTWVGHGWRVTGSRDVRFLNETYPGGPLQFEIQYNWLGTQGDAGAAPTLTTGTLTVGDSPTDAAFSIEQVSPNAYAVNARLPKGNPGEDSTVPGPTATIATASDADGLAAAAVGEFIYKKSNSPIQFGAKKVSLSPGVYKRDGSHADWATIDTGTNWTAEYIAITSMVIEAQSAPWEPEVFGLCEMQVSGYSLRVDLEARLGAVGGPLLARGAGPSISDYLNQWHARQLVPAADESVLPGSSATIVPADTAATIYLIARKVDATNAIRLQARKTRGYLRVRPMPVAL